MILNDDGVKTTDIQHNQKNSLLPSFPNTHDTLSVPVLLYPVLSQGVFTVVIAYQLEKFLSDLITKL